MAESITISKTPPDFKSMRFDLLREEGLKHIQSLAGNLWTDNNLSDPGISILEVLSYVITDLGYRTAYSIPDILAQNPLFPQVDIKNFYTARQILPMYPVTFNDYRKLLIDVDVHDPLDIDCPIVGVKNGWIEMSPENEIPVYIQRALDKLDYKPEVITDPERVEMKCLYNILLELDKCEKYGDLNENTLEGIVTLSVGTSDPAVFAGLKVKVIVEFPRWDDPGIDWNNLLSIRDHIKRVTLVFPKLPQGYKLEAYGILPDRSVWVNITQLPTAGPMNTVFIENQINSLIYAGPSSLLVLYQQKVRKILQIIAAVRKRLMANRNLCEDIFKINALKIEEILVCADVELATDADVEETLAKIYFEIGKFLAPTVYFYSIEEMYAKGKRTEEIFEGPPLLHGFIDDAELLKAERKKVIHVSDLIQIIMDVPGVIAVKSIQIANIPEDNDDNIPSVAVKWCLDLAFEFNYVPRLSTELSKITFFKESLPYKANEEEVDKLLEEMEAADRPQNIENPVLDLPVPQGEFKDIEEYVSTQDEFPLVYGTGPEGLPESSSVLRKAQQKQLKGFLMFFDQLLADYLSQLANVRDLFSMNEERDAYGDFIIDQSYFTQSLIPSVTDAASLLVNPTTYLENVQSITEDENLFEQRRNKFLDHLMARFSEQFTDYAMMVYKLTGKKAPKELLIDKLEVLNAYPEISGGRFKAFDYESPCELWSVNNVSGLERRVSLLNGIAPRTASDLNYGDSFVMTGTSPSFGYEVYNNSLIPPLVLVNKFGSVFETVDDWKFGIEKVIINGVNRERYIIYDLNGEPVTPANPVGLPPYRFELVCCKDTVLGVDPNSMFGPFPSYPTLIAVNKAIGNAMEVLTTEFYENVESNRNNLACTLHNYIDVTLPVVVDMVPDPPTFTFDFVLYKNPFDFTISNTQLLTGSYTGKGQAKASQTIIGVDLTSNAVILSGDFTGKINTTDLNLVTINDSDTNDGNYTVVAISYNSITSETTIELSGGTLTTSIPLGSLYYNTQTAIELEAFGEKSSDEILFDIMFNGTFESRYTYDDLSGDYRFNIADRCGATLATSVEMNFNDAVATLTANHPGSTSPSNEIIILGNQPSNDGTYIVQSAIADKENVIVNVNLTLLPFAGGNLIFDGSYNVISVNRFTRTFTVNAILNRFLFPGEVIFIDGSDLNDGDYTIKSVVINGSNSEINVEENISDDAGVLGDLYYKKAFEITNIVQVMGGSNIYFKPGAEIQAVKEMVDFINLKFFSHEGFHVVEHILLRPKVYEDIFYPMITGVNTLKPGLTPEGSIELTKTYPIDSVDASTNSFIILGNIIPDLTPLMEIKVKGSTSGLNDITYNVISFTLVGSDTSIKVAQSIPFDSGLPAEGNIYFQKTYLINAGSTTDFTVLIPESNLLTIDQDSPAIITGSQDGLNDKTLKIGSLASIGSNTEIEFTDVLTHFQDDLLPINLKADCDNCKIEDPYSFIASIVLPYWQGRFINMDFRAFFERSLRLECPAHVALNICWVSCEQMEEFELKYKAWLLENVKVVKDPIRLSAALNVLIDVLIRLRTVYPGGTLHDCESDDTLQNSVILNRTALGTIQI